MLMTDKFDAAIEHLTHGQIECLMLVQQHLTSKEIAPRLGISHHTVDQRIRRALQTLGYKRRAHAARFVASRYSQAAMFQSATEGHEALVENQPRPAIRQHGKPTLLPFPTRHGQRNDMSIPVRLLWISGIALGAAFSAGIYLAGLESLARLIQQL
jgi:DNA-binding CsgD family transcriptional regulator